MKKMDRFVGRCLLSVAVIACCISCNPIVAMNRGEQCAWKEKTVKADRVYVCTGKTYSSYPYK